MPLFNNVNLNSPLSLYSIPVVYFTAFYPSTWKFLTIKGAIGYNNVQPRANSKAANLPPKLAARIERMEGAHYNGMETLPLWVAAVLAGNYAGLDNRWLNKLAISFIAVRLLFNHTYISFNTLGQGWARTGLFFLSLSYPIRILLKAAAKVANN